MRKIFALLAFLLSLNFAINCEKNDFFIHFSPIEATIVNCEEQNLPYERFVGLGNCCVTRGQINNHLSRRFNLDVSCFGGGQLFDWLVIHDYWLFARALENRLTDIFEKKDLLLGPTWDPGYDCVKNHKYQMTWNHMFSRINYYTIDPNILDTEYEEKKHKVDYLTQKFIDLKNYRTLYVVAYPCVGNSYLLTKEPDRKTIVALRNALAVLRGNTNFTLLYCPLVKTFGDFGNICVREIVNSPTIPPHGGDFECWDALLSEFPYTLNKIELDHSQLDHTF